MLNDDTCDRAARLAGRRWSASRSNRDVGVVGCRLLYADGTLQHGGILCNAQPLHIFHGFAGDDPGPFGLLEIDREVTAVTGACLLTPRRRVRRASVACPSTSPSPSTTSSTACACGRRGRRVIWTASRHAVPLRVTDPRAARVAERRSPSCTPAGITSCTTIPYGNPNFAPMQAVWLPAQRATVRAALGNRLRSSRH